MRTESEPQSAAWNYSEYVSAPMDHDHSCWEAGCKTAVRRTPRRRRRARPQEEPTAGPSEAAPTKEPMWDIMFAGYDSHGSEVSFAKFLHSHLPEDYPHDPKDLEACIRTYGPVITTGDLEDQAMQLYEEYCEWYKKEVPIADQLESHTAQEPGSSVIEEHIAGPTCRAGLVAHAYSGYELSFEEMKACTTVQCLGPKTSEFMLGRGDQAWKSSRDDEDFERTTDYCLSGLGDRPGSIEEPAPCYPSRHGAKYIWPISYVDFSRGSLPFHPYCLEVYKRVSLFHQGSIGITELAEKVNRRARWQAPMHPAVESAQDQWWDHERGSEFLVANPVHIPALRDILERATLTEDHSVPQNKLSNLNLTSTASPSRKNKAKDPFATLPQELLDSIASHLPYTALTALRLATPSFQHLPNSLWHRLVRSDMPWLWEAWSDLPYSFWSCTTARELQAHDKPLTPTAKTLLDLSEEQKKKLRAKNSRARRKFRKPRPAQRLDLLSTDWEWVYCRLEQEGKSIKGLRNRERIWYALAHVVQGTAESREVLEKLHADYEKDDGMR